MSLPASRARLNPGWEICPSPFVSAAGQHAMELVAGADVELGEDLVQVVFDGAPAHEQLGGDLGVGQAVAGQPGDLGLPGGELGGGLGGAFADSLAGGTAARARLRSANPSAPIAANISCAVRSCSRASMRRFSRRSHSP